MASMNSLSRELVFKIVFYGPGLCGKTTTLEWIHRTTRPDHRGKLVSLATPVDRTLYFDFLPLRLPPVRGMSVRLQLFTVPGQVYFNATRKLVLTGADGVVFVSDSQRARRDSNLESLENLRENLADQGRSLGTVPHVFQHNKRDLGEVDSLEELDDAMNGHDAPSIGTVATRGDGIFDVLDAISAGVLSAFEETLPEAKSSPSPSFGAAEGGLARALRDASPGEEIGADRREPSSGALRMRVVAAEREALRDETREAPPDRAPISAPAPAGISFAELWPAAEQARVRAVEAAIVRGDFKAAIELCDDLVRGSLAAAAAFLDPPDADPLLVPSLLGLDGRRLLSLRRMTREVRAGSHATSREALAAFAFAIEARLARSSLSLL